MEIIQKSGLLTNYADVIKESLVTENMIFNLPTIITEIRQQNKFDKIHTNSLHNDINMIEKQFDETIIDRLTYNLFSSED